MKSCSANGVSMSMSTALGVKLNISNEWKVAAVFLWIVLVVVRDMFPVIQIL